MTEDANAGSGQHVRSAHRLFYTMPQKPSLKPGETLKHVPEAQNYDFHIPELSNPSTHNASGSRLLMKYINDNIVGKELVFRGPFGDRKGMYGIFAKHF